MKRKKGIIWSSIFLCIGLIAWYTFTHFFAVANTFRDARLRMAGYASHSIQLDSSTVNYLEGGNGKKNVVLIHGFGLDGATTWFLPLLDMSDEFHFIVPDLLWFGESTSSLAPTLPNQAQMIWQLCDSLHIQPDALVGISYGGFVSFEMIHQRPEGAKKLVIVNSPGPTFQEEDIKQLCARAQVNAPDELFIPTDVAGLQHLFRFVFAEEPPIPDFAYEQIFETETMKNADLKRALMRDLVNNAARYRGTGYPTHTENRVIWSKKDQVFPLANGNTLADSLHAKFFLLEESGHVPSPKDQAHFIAALKTSLSE